MSQNHFFANDSAVLGLWLVVRFHILMRVKFGGRLTKLFAKAIAKMRGIFKANTVGNFGDIAALLLQQSSGVIETGGADEF